MTGPGSAIPVGIGDGVLQFGVGWAAGGFDRGEFDWVAVRDMLP